MQVMLFFTWDSDLEPERLNLQSQRWDVIVGEQTSSGSSVNEELEAVWISWCVQVMAADFMWKLMFTRLLGNHSEAYLFLCHKHRRDGVSAGLLFIYDFNCMYRCHWTKVTYRISRFCIVCLHTWYTVHMKLRGTYNNSCEGLLNSFFVWFSSVIQFCSIFCFSFLLYSMLVL